MPHAPRSDFHPAVRRWFRSRFAAPTPPQAEGWRAIREGRHTLIAAPTGSGKTLAAFLSALDELVREGEGSGELPDELRVLYVSPLKALAADIHRNLALPRRGIREAARDLGLDPVRITAAVRSGDTPAGERQAMVRIPPHILATTPESLYLLLTAARGRELLGTVRTVIVDEIHAVIESRRGAHLALSLERLEALAGRPIQRIGLSATQRPIEEVARFLVGAAAVDEAGRPDCAIVDAGHLRALDLGLEVPDSPLEAVMSHEAWEEVYDRLAVLAGAHRTTLVFVNTRRMAERVARHLADRLGEEGVTAHHGSLSRESRLDAERRLKEGRLRALVATASLELGIDIGHLDLVCQLGSPRRISTFLQRVGRSGHTVEGTPRGRLFPLSRDDLVECAALLRAARRGDLDRIVPFERPLDVLAQQVVAEVAAREWEEGALFERCRRAWPYRGLERGTFDELVRGLAGGVRTSRGRRAAHLHRDAVHGKLRARKGARLTALTSGGAIPDTGDYRVLLEPEGTLVGTLNEDFAFESQRGDIFQLGNSSWRVEKVEVGVVRVSDAHGQPPTIPFWLGEAPGRSDELSEAISDLRRQVSERLGEGAERRREAARWLEEEIGIPGPAAFQIVHHLAEAKRLLGVIPTRDTLVLERFFDEAGGMQLILHAPFGSRLNRAWGLALRKRFCRKFNFELQAAATENGVLLSLGPQHSFPLDEVFGYLRERTVRDVLVQALLDSPLFQTRWRWVATISLAVRRWRNGRRSPPQLQRMEAEDLLAAVFPDAAACFEHIEGGEREIPDHPLVEQAIRDCLTEAMDLPGLEAVLGRIRRGEVELVARDTPEPSTLSHELLTARAYAFLDDAPAEERRAQAVYARRALEPSSARDLGALDAEAIERVRDEAWPEPGDADELHDALLVSGFLTAREVERGRSGAPWLPWARELAAAGRACLVSGQADAGTRVDLWVAAERLPELRRVHTEASADPPVTPPAPAAGLATPISRPDAVRELVRGRLEVTGPRAAAALAAELGVAEGDAEEALLALEGEGSVLRGHFTPAPGPSAEGASGTSRAAADPEREWCDRRLLARIHRYTLRRLRAEIAPVSAADFMRFLFEWQRAEPGHQAAGLEGLAAVVEQLDGFELAAAAWEPDVLTARCEQYEPELLDSLCLGGRVIWGRLSPPAAAGGAGGFASGPLRSSPVALFRREHAGKWLELAGPADRERLSTPARTLLKALEGRGASFFDELADAAGLLPTRAERALGELAAHGLVTSDGFGGLRALLTPSDRRPPLGGARGRRRGRSAPYGVRTAGRWALLRGHAAGEAVETFARVLLRRYGVVFRRLLVRESLAPPWRELALVYRRLEARGEIRGGRFVEGFSGEQFAHPEAVGRLRAVRRREPAGRLLSLSAADPLNLVGIVTAGERVPAVASTRIAFRDGVPVAVSEGGRTRSLVHRAAARELPDAGEVERVLTRRISPALRWYVGRAG